MKANTNIRDLWLVSKILRDVLIRKSYIPENVKWFDFYIIIMKEIAFNIYCDILS